MREQFKRGRNSRKYRMWTSIKLVLRAKHSTVFIIMKTGLLSQLYRQDPQACNFFFSAAPPCVMCEVPPTLPAYTSWAPVAFVHETLPHLVKVTPLPDPERSENNSGKLWRGFLIWQTGDFAENRQIKSSPKLFHILSHYAETLEIAKFNTFWWLICQI